MSIRPGSLVRIKEARAPLLVAPFCHYAYAGRTGVVTEAIIGGGWRVSFDPDLAGAKARRIVLADRDLVAVGPGPAAAPRRPTPRSGA